MLVGSLRTKWHIVDAYSVSCDCLSFLSLSGADRVQVENVGGGGSCRGRGGGRGSSDLGQGPVCVVFSREMAK